MIFDDFKVIIIQFNEKQVNVEEIHTMLSSYKDLRFLFDAIFSLGRTQAGFVTEGIITLIKRYKGRIGFLEETKIIYEGFENSWAGRSFSRTNNDSFTLKELVNFWRIL